MGATYIREIKCSLMVYIIKRACRIKKLDNEKLEDNVLLDLTNKCFKAINDTIEKELTKK